MLRNGYALKLSRAVSQLSRLTETPVTPTIHYSTAKLPTQLLSARGNTAVTMPMRGKRKCSALAEPPVAANEPLADIAAVPPAPKRRGAVPRKSNGILTNPNVNGDIKDDPDALRASPSAEGADERIQIPLEKVSTLVQEAKVNGAPAKPANGVDAGNKKPADDDPDPETQADGEEAPAEAEVKEALARPPPVNSDYLPLPWKGRLGYACLNTYLRSASVPVFSSRTCRIQSILDHRHPLRNPDEPEHATKNRPDKTQPAEIWRGQKYVEELGLANARDIPKMLRWNHKYGIKFMRLSSEMFPFASHEEYGYKLAPFASEVLAEAGRVAGELGHRLTTHPGQLGSPRSLVIENAIRDLEFHAEMLSLLRLPPQQDRDAVMILHMGGMFGSKEETLDRFRTNYPRLSQNVRNRLVLENDDMGWSVHDLLPICEELNIPFVLDFHHHNIVFDASQIREGTKDIMELYPRILATWHRKNITPKMHYSEPTPAAITPRQRRKHSPRVATLPPCPADMDLMIEAKDKEQAVFELMRTFKLPGYEKFNDIIPFVRDDETRLAKPYTKKELKDRAAAELRGETLSQRQDYFVSDEEAGMGGLQGRVYWPPTMEEWLRPEKVVKKEKAAPKKAANGSVNGDVKSEAPSIKSEAGSPAPSPKATAATKAKAKKATPVSAAAVKPKATPKSKTPAKANGTPRKTSKKAAISDEEDEAETSSEEEEEMSDLSPEMSPEPASRPRSKTVRGTTAQKAAAPAQTGTRTSRRSTGGRVSYREADEDEE